MADPANVIAANASTSQQRKRVLRSQLRSEAAKRRRRSVGDSHSPSASSTSSSRHRSPSTTNNNLKAVDSINTKTSSHRINSLHKSSNRTHREEQFRAASSSTSSSRLSQDRTENSGSSKYCTRNFAKSNHIDIAHQVVDIDEYPKRKKSNRVVAKDTSEQVETASTSSEYDIKRRLRYSSTGLHTRHRDGEEATAVAGAHSKKDTKQEENNSRKFQLRNQRNRFHSDNSESANLEDHLLSSSSSSNFNNSQGHNYSLRSQNKFQQQQQPSTASSSSSHLDSNNRNQSNWKKSIPRKRKALALGTASSSNSGTRATAPPPPQSHQHGTAPNSFGTDSQGTSEPNRLTRSGAVLRRSTRNKRGQGTSTTGSCASSSGGASSGSGAAASSRGRASTNNNTRTQKSRLPLPVTSSRSHTQQFLSGLLPTSQSAAAAHAMAADQPPVDVPSGSLADESQAAHESAAQPPPSATGGGGGGGAAGATGGGGGPSGTGADSESDDSEVGRLQALLEARGLPPHLFGALGPRMQHLLHRSMGSNSSVTRAQALIPGLQATGDEGQQLQAVIEMCQILVMGNEEILTGFPVKQVVPALITLLQMEHNFDIMNHACRALSYMMEALPRSSAVVVDAVPVFLEKLQVIQCMDVAEQSLTALDMLSRRHSKSILQARGVAACLTYLDFFPINAQRNAFSVTANCCLNLTNDEFQYVQTSLSLLASRLTQQDKKCVESVCLAFSRLVDSFQLEPNKLQEIASSELLTNLQQLLVVTPPIISTPTFITVLRMLSVMCSNCPDLAITLLKQSIAETLFYLLTGSTEINQDHVDLVPRQPQELFEITSLIGELMPKLPTDGIFSVDSLLEKSVNIVKDQPVWQWRDDRGWWHPYGAVDSRIIESAHQSAEDEVSLNTIGRIYTVDFHAMQQVNEDTGTSRPVQRLCTPAASKPSTSEPIQATTNRPASSSRDARVACLREERGLAAAFIRSLFAVLYEVYSSSAGPAVRYKCLRALLRMVYYASPKLLKEVLKNQVVSSHLAGMMASSDLRIVVGAVQMAKILMNKLPDDFGVHFRREGVFYQFNQLADPEVPLGVSPPKSTSCLHSAASSSIISSGSESQPGTSQSSISNNLHATTINGSTALVNNSTPLSMYSATSADSHRSSHQGDNDVRSPNSLRLGDVLRRKRVSKRSSGGGGGGGSSSSTGGVGGGASSSSNRQKGRQDDLPLSPSLMQDFFSKAASLANSTSSNSSQANNSRLRYSSSTSKTSFLQNLNPARWARSMNSSSHERNFGKDSLNTISKSSSNSQITAGNKEKTRQWIREQANKFIETHSNIDGDQHPATAILNRLKLAIEKLNTSKCREALLELREILIESDISPFEVNHSGLIKALLSYLSDVNRTIDRDQRLRILLNVFGGFPLETGIKDVGNVNSVWMRALVTKLNLCVSHLEQFPVKVHDFPTSAGVGRGCTSALKFFNTHQLKCNLQRHPECNNLKQWKGGTVKIDPLALVQAIERYLLVRGYGRLKDKDSADSEDGDSDTDIDDTLASVAISQAGSKHKLQFLIGNNVLPHNMTVYQAVRQFSFNGNDQSETDTDNETPMSNAGIWVQTHVIYYRPIKEDLSANHKTLTNSGTWNHSSRKGKGSSGKNSSRRKGDELWTEGITPVAQSLLKPYLTMQLPDTVTVQDASLEVLCVLRILHALNLYWGTLYTNTECGPILPSSVFINSKIAAKANRQLQDPLVIMTGNLPKWLNQIATACPFLFPFETRQLLFYATSFDRDRALQRLIEITPELSSNDSQERVTPRLDRRKRTISREDILKQAEQVMQDLAGSKALLEVQYEDEVGTGLGPTLEFYALVSKELQKHNLDLWYAPNKNQSESEYVHNAMGLFPGPIAKGAKLGPITKIKSKYRFIGKLMAKAVMDSRMLDLPFSLTFYRWLLGQEHSLTLADLLYVNSDLYITLKKMQDIVSRRDDIVADINLSEGEKTEKVEKLEYDGCPIEDLGIDFVIPGYNVELMKNGKNTHLTIHNLHLYVKLLTHWMLIEGVSRQMEALREGFDSVFPSRHLNVFQPDELEQVFCGTSKDQVSGWDVKTLMECCKPDHGYTADSKAIHFLFEILSTYNKEEQRMFLQFLTGSPRLPVGGFKALSPPLTIVRKTTEAKENPDDFLPSVMTCVNYLKLPDYSSIEVMRQKLAIAASEGQHSFYLS